MGNQTRWKAGHAIIALLMGIVLGLAGVVCAPVAQAAEVDAIVPDSIKLVKHVSMGRLHLWNSVRVEAQWRIPDGSGKAGDTFTLTLPLELEGGVGSFDLIDQNDNSLSFGSCQVSKRELECTLNANVENKYNVGGSLWFSAQIIDTFDEAELTFTLLGGVMVDVPLPDGQVGVTIRSDYPTDVLKDGWFVGGLQQVKWRVVIPGSRIASTREVSVVDNYAVPGFSLTMVSGFPRVFSVKATAECWNRNWLSGCRTDVTEATDPSASVTVDDDADEVTVKLVADAAPFDPDRIYVVELLLNVDKDIPAGSLWTNKATVNGTEYTAWASRRYSGGGLGTGTQFAGLRLRKAVTGTGVVDTEGFVQVAYSYEYDGKVIEGVLPLKLNGEVAELNDLPHDVVISLREQMPTTDGVVWGDPMYTGDDVVDGGPNSVKATVKVTAGLYSDVLLTNPAAKLVKVSPVNVAAGTCPPGATVATPVVVTGAQDTDEIDYSDPVITVSGSTVVVTVTAKAKDGYVLDTVQLPTGWVAGDDDELTFTGAVIQPDCKPTPGGTVTPTPATPPKRPGLPRTGA